MATRLEPLKLAHPNLFGVRVVGTVGPGDRDRLRELADKCLDRGKLRLVMDLAGMNAVGGGGARTLAEFQESLIAADGEAVFCGATDLVRHFLEQKFDGLPLRFYRDVAEAEAACAAESDEACEVGAVALADLDDEDPEASTASVAEVVGAAAAAADEPEVTGGRRKEHQYTSLSDAVASLGRWTAHDDKAAFATALGNMLFSHGLADQTVLLVRRGELMIEPGGERVASCDGGLVKGVAAVRRPLTLLDLAADELDEVDTTLLAAVDPDVILPVHIDDALAAMVMLRREGDEREYSVAENFALELLMRVLTARDEAVPAAAAVDEDEDAPSGQPAWAPDGTTTAEVLLQLALDLPEAVDRPHFWRIFARHGWPVLPINQLGFLAADRARPQIMVGGNDSWMGLDLGNERLQLYFATIERPVAVANMPSFFKDVRHEMRQAGVDWVVSLKWDGAHLGTVLLELNRDFTCDDTTGLLEELFTETSRLLHRYDGSNDNADVNLELVRILVSLHEKHTSGSDANTAAMVAHISRLARVMAFPPDQERDLVYGCLLRDVGLFDKAD
ncbi:MAG TPA: hypothetical protein PLQ13_02605, partial [Candidatus Krumholzibacteria bacterium]|nr:hypothetical protein [Candidatus Krumholzibacteria bacterium]